MDAHPKRVGFLSFGAWHPAAGATDSAADDAVDADDAREKVSRR